MTGKACCDLVSPTVDPATGTRAPPEWSGTRIPVMSISVGPYTFSVNDARATLAHLDDLLDCYPAAAQEALTGRRAELRQIADAVGDTSSSDDENLAAAVTDAFPLILEARQTLIESGAQPDHARGIVAQLNASDGGVPKSAVDTVEVDHRGLVGDRQATRQHHGRPWQALCLWSTDVIDQLKADGHPIFAGAAGENITVSGIDWSTIVMGTRLRIGTVLAQISAPAVPCAKNARWFSDRDFSRIHHRNGPLSRLYATVIEPGSIATGDAVVVEPAPTAQPIG